MDIEDQEQTQTEQQMLSNLTKEQLLLVAAWLHEESTLRVEAGYSEEVYNTLKYIASRLEILATESEDIQWRD